MRPEVLSYIWILIIFTWIAGYSSREAKYEPCDGEIRLVSGIDNSSGFVEIFFRNSWGVICNHYWKADAARVACRQLGYEDGVPKPGAKYEFRVPEEVMQSRQQLPAHLSSVVCSGREPTLLHCNFSTSKQCLPEDHVALNCLGTRDSDVINVCSFNFRSETSLAVCQNEPGLVNIITIVGCVITVTYF